MNFGILVPESAGVPDETSLISFCYLVEANLFIRLTHLHLGGRRQEGPDLTRQGFARLATLIRSNFLPQLEYLGLRDWCYQQPRPQPNQEQCRGLGILMDGLRDGACPKLIKLRLPDVDKNEQDMKVLADVLEARKALGRCEGIRSITGAWIHSASAPRLLYICSATLEGLKSDCFFPQGKPAHWTELTDALIRVRAPALMHLETKLLPYDHAEEEEEQEEEDAVDPTHAISAYEAGADIIEALARGAAPNLQDLHLSRLPLRIHALTRFSDAIASGALSKLVHLSLTNCDLGDMEIGSIATAMHKQGCSTLKVFYFQANKHLTALGLHFIADMLRAGGCRNLEVIDGFDLRKGGGIGYLIQSLYNGASCGSSLRLLSAWKPKPLHFKERELQLLASTLHTRGLPSLQRLDLTGNESLDDVIFEKFTRAFTSGAGRSLSFLGLGWTTISPMSISRLATALRAGACPNLTEIQVPEGFDIGPLVEAMQALGKGHMAKIYCVDATDAMGMPVGRGRRGEENEEEDYDEEDGGVDYDNDGDDDEEEGEK